MRKPKNTSGYAVIELNHGGIPDDELKPEDFDELQNAVLNALPAERQETIRQGCPVIVINMETGERIAAFNLKNVKPDKYQMESFARGILDMMMKDMAEKRDKENK
ncbi:MAG: hypothetical protein IJI71_08715 [Clostridia bacterium]|nr:hypothetical protein [Clostridia bacterium]